MMREMTRMRREKMMKVGMRIRSRMKLRVEVVVVVMMMMMIVMMMMRIKWRTRRKTKPTSASDCILAARCSTCLWCRIFSVRLFLSWFSKSLQLLSAAVAVAVWMTRTKENQVTLSDGDKYTHTWVDTYTREHTHVYTQPHHTHTHTYIYSHAHMSNLPLVLLKLTSKVTIWVFKASVSSLNFFLSSANNCSNSDILKMHSNKFKSRRDKCVKILVMQI